jgi:membrane protein
MLNALPVLLFRLGVDFIKLCASAFNEFLSKNGPYMAAAISFYSIFSMFPLLLAVLAIFGFLLNSAELQHRLVEEIPRQWPTVDAQLVQTVLNRVNDGKIITSVMATVGLIWTSMTVFGAIRKSTNLIWGIQRTRPFLQERMMDFTLMLGASLLLVISVFTTTVLSFFQEIFMVLAPESGPSSDDFWSRVAISIPPVTMFVTFLIIYTWLPYTRVRLRESWLPALLASIAFNIAAVVFVQWLREFPAYKDVYGGISAVIAFMAWVYVSSIIMLVGAMFTARYAAFLSAVDQRKKLRQLHGSLERIRSQPVVLAPLTVGD